VSTGCPDQSAKVRRIHLICIHRSKTENDNSMSLPVTGGVRRWATGGCIGRRGSS